MSWTAIKQFDNKGGQGSNIEYIHDGPNVVDARLFFGKYCFDSKIGVLLSEIITCKGGRGYIKWLRDGYPKTTEDLMSACEEVLGRY